MHRLSSPAPHRDTYTTANGLWASRPWCRASVLSLLKGGGWIDFTDSAYDFEEGSKGWCQEAQRHFLAMAREEQV